MKGKLLINKIMRPSIVFATGVLVVLFLLSFFLYLHISAVHRIEEINGKIGEVDNLIVKSLAEYPGHDSSLSVLETSVEQLYAYPGMEIILTLYSDVLSSPADFTLASKGDIISLYNRISLLKEKISEHSVAREETFRVLYVLILVVVIAMFLLLGISQFETFKVIQLEQERNETNSKLYDQLEKERSLLAFELHDDIAQKLAVIKRYFNSRNSIDEHTNLMEHYASDVIRRVRYLSRMLKAPDNPDISFKDYLETLFADFNVLSDYKLNRKTVGLGALRLTPLAALHIYRIIQEVLTNSRIHSEATEIDLLIVYSHPTLTIKYKDNGKGFEPYLIYKKGIGLDSIKYRLDLLKGKYQLSSAEGEGTDISIDIPVELCEISS
ncbi:sensor histidine kinase [Spirochaeta isovalerica]|uniref:histidine kinase n=1 Tax=Spirochaeta isovalerica TaxID=150 RepID=A0A841RCN7_9SPIO|nr:ATP-binding protein [Spirochaeta isovalerica]MBB6481703.1 signal transduction histidine kinase [Spirochaeta isovalerica]